MPDDPLNFSLLKPAGPHDFEASALSLFRHQAAHNQVYRNYLYFLGKDPASVHSLLQIPFLPIGFFKNFKVLTGSFGPEKIFRSSGTTGRERSAHAVRSLQKYQEHSQELFEAEYGPLTDWVIIALLPSYIVQGDSSLVYMAEHFIKASNCPVSGFFLHQPGELAFALTSAEKTGRKILLLGVSYALLDLIETEKLPRIQNLVVMETGGMKGRRKELVRQELHDRLMAGFGVGAIHSEYGMTELLSQAYSAGNGRFKQPWSLKIMLRETNDPFSKTLEPGRGGINIIDLANTDSCAFIETQDLGQLHDDGTFEVLGRFDNSDIRGCSLLV